VAYSGARYPSVPCSRVDCTVLGAPALDMSLASPKSDTTAVQSPSKSTLLDVKSRWMMGGDASSCRYASALADWAAIVRRWRQLERAGQGAWEPGGSKNGGV
jgi:hypothetical protein